MKIGVIGVGAVGGYYGAKLAKAGNNVTFITTERNQTYLREHGLIIKSYQGDFEIKKPHVGHDFKFISDADLILFCVKSYHTKEVAAALKPRISEKATIISMQNGVENEDILAEIFGRERVIGAAVYISSSMPDRNVIKHTGFGKVIFGELNGEISDRIRMIEQLFLNASIPAGVSSNIKKDLWKKLILNIASNGFASIIGKPLSQLHEIPEAMQAFISVIKEAQMVASKEGYEITDDDLDDIIRITDTESFKNFKPSTLQDIEAGKNIEIDAMQGAIIRAAKKHGLEVPVNNLIYALLKLKY